MKVRTIRSPPNLIRKKDGYLRAFIAHKTPIDSFRPLVVVQNITLTKGLVICPVVTMKN